MCFGGGEDVDAMNKRAKGKLLVKKAKELLEAEGYLVEVCRPKLMFIGPGKVISREEDFFGKWDILAVPKNPPLGQKLRFIQVSVKEARSAKLKQVAGFPPSPHYTQEIWLYEKDGRSGGFHIEIGPF